MLKAQEVKKKNKKYPNKIKLYAAPRTNLRRLVSNCRFCKYLIL